MVLTVAMAYMGFYVDCQGTVDTLALGRGRGTLTSDSRPHMWRTFCAALDVFDLVVTTVRAHGTMADAHAGQISHEERRAAWRLKRMRKLCF